MADPAKAFGDPIFAAGLDALQQPEKLLDAYFRSSAVGLCIYDAESRYLAINDALARMNGVPAEDHIGKTAREILGDYASRVEADVQQVISTGEAKHHCHGSGHLPGRADVGHWACHLVPIKNADGKVTQICSVVLEVTEQKRLERSLEEVGGRLSREAGRFQTLLDIGGILAANWDVPKVFPAISARLRRLFRQEYADFSLFEAGSGLLVRQAEDFPMGKGQLRGVPIYASESPGGRALQRKTPLIYSYDQLQLFNAEIAKKLLAEGIRSLCCIPLLRPWGPLGVLVLGSTRQNAFHPGDLDLLHQVAAQLATAIENQRTAAEIEALQQRLGEEKKYLEDDARDQGHFGEIIGDSPALRHAMDQAALVASSDATVLVLGETGTGKELVARAIHHMSNRRDRAFIKVNCAAIPTGLLESELYGHERGAFTGAVARKIGRMELADGGTLFLDEIGEIPLELQPKLLRVLQDQEFERLGSNRTLKVNLRLVAATNRDLVRSVAEHKFRNDLFYRINVFPIQLPSLRQRREDIPVLVRHFVRKFALRMDRHIETIPNETMKALTAWSWPGNVRELENLMERSVIMTHGPALRVPLRELRQESPTLAACSDSTLDNAEREHILRVLRETGGMLSGPNGAAQRLGLKRTTLQSKMQRLKIARSDYSDASNSDSRAS